MTNYEKLKEIFPEIPEYSGIDVWGDFWEQEYKKNDHPCEDCQEWEWDGCHYADK